MGFHDVRFTTRQSYTTSLGPGFRTGVLELGSGADERVQRWAAARHRGDLRENARSPALFQEIKTFHMARGGAANSWRLKDWSDFTTAADGQSAPTATDQLLGVGDGTKTVFQMVKNYTSGSVTHARKLILLVNGTVLASLNSTPTVAFSVDILTGLITFNTAPGAGVLVKAGCEFDTKVRFDADADEWLRADYEHFRSFNLSIPIIQDPDPDPGPEELPYRGAKTIAYEFDRRVTLADGFFINAQPATTIRKLVIPKATARGAGAPHLHIKNTGTIATDLYEDGADPLVDLPTTLSVQLAINDHVICVIGKDTDNLTNRWFIA